MKSMLAGVTLALLSWSHVLAADAGVAAVVEVGVDANAVAQATAHAAATWEIDSARSSLGFATIKNGVVGEGHQFLQLNGTVAANGAARLQVLLNSVDTGIAIRDQRMRELLFEVGQFPVAELSAQVPVQELVQLAVGDNLLLPLELQLKIHGAELNLAATVRVQRLAVGRMQVATVRPVIVNADSLGLTAGVEQLRQLAGLESISPAVSVSVLLEFSPRSPAPADENATAASTAASPQREISSSAQIGQ